MPWSTTLCFVQCCPSAATYNQVPLHSVRLFLSMFSPSLSLLLPRFQEYLHHASNLHWFSVAVWYKKEPESLEPLNPHPLSTTTTNIDPSNPSTNMAPQRPTVSKEPRPGMCGQSHVIKDPKARVTKKEPKPRAPMRKRRNGLLNTTIPARSTLMDM
jgi:hypothetical protein